METVVEMDPKKVALIDALKPAQPLVLPIAEAAKAALELIDIPTRRTEAWKYTRVNKIISGDWKTSSNMESKELKDVNWKGSYATFVDGKWADSDFNSQTAGCTCASIAKAKETHTEAFAKIGSLSGHETDLFEALNAVNAEDGVFIHIEKNQLIEDPMWLDFQSTEGVASHPRNLIIVEEGAQLNMAMTHRDATRAFHNGCTEIFLGANARLHIDFIQETGERFDLNTVWVAQEKDSNFTLTTITQNADWVRNNVNVRINGSGCETNLYGSYRCRNKEHVDNHTMIDHKVPHCDSNELYKGILYDKSTGVFNGKVFVREDAQKTNAFQQNANIVMDDSASMNSKPELEIYADDVKCSHGSTTGQFDEEAIFYLMARGISENNARELLVEAFLSEVSEHLKFPELL